MGHSQNRVSKVVQPTLLFPTQEKLKECYGAAREKVTAIKKRKNQPTLLIPKTLKPKLI